MHIVCASCGEKLRPNGCAYCRSKPIAHSRCLAVEKVMESVVTSCRYAPEGCQEMLKLLLQKERHETELCAYRPQKQKPRQEPTTLVPTPQHRQKRLHEVQQRRLQREEQLQQHPHPLQEESLNPGRVNVSLASWAPLRTSLVPYVLTSNTHASACCTSRLKASSVEP